MSKALRLEGPNEDGIATVWIDQEDRKVNVLNTDLMPEFSALLEQAKGNRSLKALIITSGKASGFIAGADIDMLNEATSAEEGSELSARGQEAMNALAALKIPTIAAIHGDCLGGGLELALACKARVASNHSKTKMALPEVMLGLLPGAGGTRRLPKLVGLASALDMMLTGRNIRAKKALKMGLIDRLVPVSQLQAAAQDLAREMIKGKKPARPKKGMVQGTTDFFINSTPLGRKVAFDKARAGVMKKSLGLYPSPLKIIEVIAADSDKAEAEGFGQLLMTPESQGLRHLFRCITELKKDNGPGTEELEPVEAAHVGMLGAGLMGGGIATVLADKGITVRLKDLNWDGINAALGYAIKFYKKAVKRKIYRREGLSERMNRLSGTLTYDGFGQADIVIEAVPENLALKQQMVADIEAKAEASGKPIVFATNTSSLPITAIAEHAKHPERVIGMHYFSPVEKMPLVEVIVTDKTAPEVTLATVLLARRMGKHVIVVNDCAGFYTTRVLAPYMTEAMFMLLEGYDVHDIDQAEEEAGFPVGPITLMDEVGIDVGDKVIKVMKQYYGERMKFPDASISEAFLAEGRFGRKASKGFYLYEDGESRTEEGRKLVDSSITKHLPQGISPKRLSSKAERAELAQRLVLALVNEAAHCLQEGILREPMAGDLGAIMGIGFPPFEGGPFRYVHSRGAAAVVAKLRKLEKELGSRFTPAENLIHLGETGGSFYDPLSVGGEENAESSEAALEEVVEAASEEAASEAALEKVEPEAEEPEVEEAPEEIEPEAAPEEAEPEAEEAEKAAAEESGAEEAPEEIELEAAPEEVEPEAEEAKKAAAEESGAEEAPKEE